eukprot:CAMPEP_0194329966 /NCGR_PEP_ID=MMETSP0171-20130528/49999_1 /TAXON_ID=218684 /ORGANISM="Corethron pennatum, Strain L29A3" /LENGTH=372 /DNA_ID=CAMNT_0039090863 /DNA_START=100 /DNA_END=1214 /DNA_ORIENTATION=+
MDALDASRRGVAGQLAQRTRDLVAARVVGRFAPHHAPGARGALLRCAALLEAADTETEMGGVTFDRQEYLKAFEECVGYIPCWVMTTNQVPEYLPPRLGQFDLVVIDEASQCDISVLPVLMRGTQWLLVGDGRQGGPRDGFVTDTRLDGPGDFLCASPFRASFRSGHSLLDLAAQAFPRNRVLLTDHYRCAPELIAFCNRSFYKDRLVPLRLPTREERLAPSLVDLRLPGGTATGTTNQHEADAIVTRIEGLVVKNGIEGLLSQKEKARRSIGIISLGGGDQCRLLRTCLLDAIGATLYQKHRIFIGEPPCFQGVERDIVFLSLVCSPDSVPVQNTREHMHNTNIALSRARDQLILVRSIDRAHLAHGGDVR